MLHSRSEACGDAMTASTKIAHAIALMDMKRQDDGSVILPLVEYNHIRALLDTAAEATMELEAEENSRAFSAAAKASVISIAPFLKHRSDHYLSRMATECPDGAA